MSWCSPARISSHVLRMSWYLSSSSLAPLWLALAAPFFNVAYAVIISRGIRSWPMLKCSSERCVCAPHSLSAGTSTTPILSVSLRTSVIAPLSQIKQTWANFLIGLLPRVDLWHGNIETVQGDGHHAIQPDEIDELC